jgi:hypothetical protein
MSEKQEQYGPPAVIDRPAAPLVPRNIGEMLRFGEVMISSGLLPEHIKRPEQAVALIVRGRELGLPDMYSLMNLVYVKGKVTCDVKTMLALAYRSGKLASHTIVESTAQRCIVEVCRAGGQPQRFSFDMAEAAALGLAETFNYKRQAAVMLQWRALAKALRATVPDGIGGLYTHEEMGAPVAVVPDKDSGEAEMVFDATPTEATALASDIGAAFDASPPAPAAAPANSNAPPLCPKCNVLMVTGRAKSAKGPLWKCPNEKREKGGDGKYHDVGCTAKYWHHADVPGYVAPEAAQEAAGGVPTPDPDQPPDPPAKRATAPPEAFAAVLPPRDLKDCWRQLRGIAENAGMSPESMKAAYDDGTGQFTGNAAAAWGCIGVVDALQAIGADIPQAIHAYLTAEAEALKPKEEG